MHTQHCILPNMNPPKYPFLRLLLSLCFSLSFAHNILDDGNLIHENEMEKQDRFGNMINPAELGQFHETDKETQDRFGNMINPSKSGEFHGENDKGKHDESGKRIKPTGGVGAGPYGWLNPPPYYKSPPFHDVGPEIGFDRPGVSCPCTLRCYYQYKLKLMQMKKALRKAKRLSVDELQNRESSDDLVDFGGVDESFGSLGLLYP